jgi:plastocyanin
MMRRLAAIAAGAALAAAGCGSSNDGGAVKSSGPGASVAIAAPSDGAKKFDPADITAKAGKVTIKFDNPSSVPHGVSIEGNGVDAAGDVITGADTSFSVELKPGKYTFYCPVGDHRAQGMEGTLTVS